MKASGSYMVGMPLVVEMDLMACRMPTKRKYRLATLWNCSNKLMGKKVNTVYLLLTTALVLLA